MSTINNTTMDTKNKNGQSSLSYMDRAIKLAAKAGLGERSGGCFGSVIVRKSDGHVISEGYNRVLTTHDPTHHAEIHAIREASRILESYDLSSCIMFSSSEPCAMCMAAIQLAKIPEVHYASSVEDARLYGQFQDHDSKNNAYGHMSSKSKVTHLIQNTDGRSKMIELWKTYADSNPRQYC